MDKVRVLMVGNDQTVKGGITSVISQILNYDWNANGVEMSFIPTYIETNNIKKIAFFIKAYYKRKAKLKNNRVDLIHIHMSYKGSFFRKYAIHKLCKKYNIPDIIHLHGSEFNKWFNESSSSKKAKIKILLREASAFIVLGQKWNEIIKQIEPNTNTIVVSNSVHIPVKTTKWKDQFYVIFLGVLIKRKGVEDLLNAIKILETSKKVINTHFIIVGTGPEEENLKSQCNKLQLDKIVDFVGWVNGEEKLNLIKESQMLVLPSYNEGLPIAILEAISYGLPVVATNVGDISAAVRDKENGFLVEVGNEQQLADRIEKIISNKNLYEKMSIKSREIAESEFSDEKYFSKLKNKYFSIIKSNN